LQNLSLDTFELIADWFHYGIFELVTTDEFREDPKWIAARLGITPAEAGQAIARLERLELLIRDRRGDLRQGPDLISTTKNDFTTKALRLQQSQLMQLAQLAMEEISMDQRDQSAMTMAIDSDDLPYVKDRIKKFRRKLCADLQKKNKRDSVYQLLISFFPLTRGEK
jgi:uncharacterized protein (TIGR02147 family)